MKKIFVYFLVLQITLLPTFRAWAFAPAVAVAWNLASSAPVRILATEIALEVVTRGFASNDPLYASTGKISRSKYLSFLKGKGKYVPYIASALVAAGFSVVDDQIMTNPQTKPNHEGDVPPKKGIAWRHSSSIGETVTSAASKKCESYQYCTDIEIRPYRYDPSREDLRTVDLKLLTGAIWVTEDYQSVYCSTLSPAQQATVPTCSPTWEPEIEVPRPSTDKEIDNDFLNWISSQPESDQRFPFSDDKGQLHPDLIPDIEVPSPPVMPDGSPLPPVGHQSHVHSDWYLRGTYQSDDPNAPNYIPPSSIEDAKFLAEDVAKGNQSITNSNATGNPLPDTDTSPNPDTPTLNIDLSGVESRIDTTNELTQGVIDELSKLNNSSKQAQSSPDSSVSSSFWEVKYPDGLSGVLNDFIEKMKSTPIFSWLDDFVINLDAGSIPFFEMCFNVIAGINFGCYTLQAESYVWSAIKASMILLSVIVSRKIVFGG